MANCFSNWRTEGVECCQGHKWNNEETSCIRRYKLCNFLFDNKPQYKYMYLYSIPFKVFFICYILACDKGYNGHNCNAICPFPTYGLDCQSICNCTETFCDPVDGCTGHTKEIGIKQFILFYFTRHFDIKILYVSLILILLIVFFSVVSYNYWTICDNNYRYFLWI